jgi:hypothetical protein
MPNRTASVEPAPDRSPAPAPWGPDFAAAERCWSWHLCPFGCQYVDDCVLTTPLPVHDHDRVDGRA